MDAWRICGKPPNATSAWGSPFRESNEMSEAFVKLPSIRIWSRANES
jgi:hypothetical protein